MLTIKINGEKTPELTETITKLISQFDVVSLSWEDEPKAKPTGEAIRSGATGKDLSAAVSAAVDRAQNGKHPG